jgi:NAD(P)-dependent dehydrogenase (short-subunit alcohol dehydrogenase family)
MARALTINGVGTAALLTCAANYCEAQGYGCIAVLGSVAGDRGRRSNYVYGASKGMIDVFMQGLRQRLGPLGVRVVTIKPGPVDTPMTEHLPKNPLFATSDYVGARVYRAMLRGKPVIYIPWFWRVARSPTGSLRRHSACTLQADRGFGFLLRRSKGVRRRRRSPVLER